MKIQLLRIILTNFKGVRAFKADFTDTTNIYGDNATGKTTLFDAFTWLLFGKDSTDRKDFEVKILDKDNKVIPKIDHEVYALLSVDGQNVDLKRVYREKWTKKRGSAEAEFTGHETLYFWNDVPLQQKEYQEKIGGMIDENLFKLITNTLYFNQMKWQDRRNVLLQLAGNITNTEILDTLVTLGNKGDFSPLINILNQGKSLDEYKRTITSQKKLLSDNLKTIPTRIDEANRSMPEELDFAGLESKKTTLQAGLSEIEQTLLDSTKAQKAQHLSISEKQNELHSLNSQIKDRQYQIRDQFANDQRKRSSEINNLQNTIDNKERDIRINQANCESRFVSINKLKGDIQRLRDDWQRVNAETLAFNDHEFTCPTCMRELDESTAQIHKQQLEDNFNTNKSQRLTKITNDGQSLGKQVEMLNGEVCQYQDKTAALRTEIEALQVQLNNLQAEHNNNSLNEAQELETVLNNDAAICELKAKAEAIQAEISNTSVEQTDNTALLTKKQAITLGIEETNKLLSTRDQINKIKQRIAELEEEERKLAQQVADLEKTEFAIEQFSKAKMDALESRINGRFLTVKFKLFQTQINGGESECCDTLVEGVPFSDANNAAKINAGLDIIRTLSKHYKVQAPVFVDNAESVVELMPMDSQVIRLVVSGDDKKLRVEHAGVKESNGQLQLA